MSAPAVSAVQEIERAVVARAKDHAVDMAGDRAEEELRKLIGEEIGRWNDDHRRGLHHLPVMHPEDVAARVFRNLARYGPLTPLLDDEDVWEIMINAPDAVFVKRHRGPSGYHDEPFHDDEHVTRTITKLLDDNSTSHRKLDATEGLQDAQLLDGSRLHIVHNELARGGHLLVNIRKFTRSAIGSLDELVERNTMDADVARFLSACVQSRLSILFAGVPGAGKTTLLTCCCAELDPSLRVVTAEEVFEADIPVANVASMQTRPARADRPAVDLRRLVAAFLRMAPDVAIVGEVRDREALPLLLTLSSGVTGYTTIHAGSAVAALSRLRFVCQLSDAASELPMSALNQLVSESIDLVVHTERGPDGPRLTSVVAVEDLAAGPASTQFTVTEVFTRDRYDLPMRWTGLLPTRAGRALERHGFDPRSLLGVDVASRATASGSAAGASTTTGNAP